MTCTILMAVLLHVVFLLSIAAAIQFLSIRLMDEQGEGLCSIAS